MTISGYDKNSLNHGVVLDLPGYEATGSVIQDISSYHNNGIITSPTWTQLSSGLSVLTMDASDRIVIANETNFDFGLTTNFTAMAWIKTTYSADVQAVLVKINYDAASYEGWSFGTANGKSAYIQLDNRTSGTKYMQAAVSTATKTTFDGVWHHICGTYDGSQAVAGFRIYIDGIIRTSASTGNSATIDGTVTNNQAVTVGSWQTGAVVKPFIGSIGKWKVYNRKLTDSEVTKIYDAERSLFGV